MEIEEASNAGNNYCMVAIPLYTDEIKSKLLDLMNNYRYSVGFRQISDGNHVIDIFW